MIHSIFWMKIPLRTAAWIKIT